MNTFILFTSILTSFKALSIKANPEVISNQVTTQEVSAFRELKEPLYFDPKSLMFTTNSRETSLKVIEVGLGDSGQLETPPNWTDAGWYYKSARPGEKGNVIIDGHYDNNVGFPAAFWALKSIKVNDKVILKDKLNRSFTYKVTDTFYVDIDDPERLQVFKESDNPILTLITCGGVWDYKSGTYNKRLVVRAELFTSDLD